jgi:hypothetical protein
VGGVAVLLVPQKFKNQPKDTLHFIYDFVYDLDTPSPVLFPITVKIVLGRCHTTVLVVRTIRMKTTLQIQWNVPEDDSNAVIWYEISYPGQGHETGKTITKPYVSIDMICVSIASKAVIELY